MIDPLANFDWPQLYKRYDAKCQKGGYFALCAPQCLDALQPMPDGDRELYYCLADNFRLRSDPRGVPLPIYQAMLFWKLYSTKRKGIVEFCKKLSREPIREFMNVELARVLGSLPPRLPREVDALIPVLTGLTKSLYGMASSCAIPVRTTLLHFIYPGVVPIFDQQVLSAVGIEDKDANHSYEFLREYIPHTWELADKYQSHFAIFEKETPVRIIDMALWVSRGR
jgi:hypothetical protein